MTDEDDERTLRPIEGHFIDLFAAQKKKPVWVIDEVITSGLTIMIGPAKDSYKSTVALAMAALIAEFPHTALPPDWVAKLHGPVMIFSAEADEGELLEVAEDGMGIKGERNEAILVALHPDDFRLDDEDAVEQMLAWVNARDPRMVILDPLANFHMLEEKDAVQMIRILRPLRKWAKENDAVFLVVHHPRKVEEGRNYTTNDVRGTSAIFGLCDNILVITPGKDPYEILMERKGKKGKPWTKAFQLGIWDRKGKNSGPSLRAVDKLIIRGIMHGFTSTSDLSMHLNISEKSLMERIMSLQRAGFMNINAPYKLLKKVDVEDLK